MKMTQQEKANGVLSWVFLQSRYARVGVTEKFLRGVARSRWIGKDEPLSADVLVTTAEKQVSAGKLVKFNRGKTAFYKLP